MTAAAAACARAAYEGLGRLGRRLVRRYGRRSGVVVADVLRLSVGIEAEMTEHVRRLWL